MEVSVTETNEVSFVAHDANLSSAQSDPSDLNSEISLIPLGIRRWEAYAPGLQTAVDSVAGQRPLAAMRAKEATAAAAAAASCPCKPTEEKQRLSKRLLAQLLLKRLA